MSWNRLRNPVVNFVNLGRLYSLPQGQKAFNHQRIPYFARSPSQPKPFYGGVNMGGLYRRDYPSPFLEPRGWAYLEDGSVFIARETYSHHDLQQILRIVDYYVRNPTDEMRALQMDRTDDRQTQMVLLEYVSRALPSSYRLMFTVDKAPVVRCWILNICTYMVDIATPVRTSVPLPHHMLPRDWR